MRNKGTTNEAWRSVMLQTDRFRLETKVVVKQTNDETKEYSETTAPVISRQLTDAPLGVGNCNSAAMSVSILLPEGDVIPKAAEVKICGRVCALGLSASNWKSFGTFFVENRRISHDGRLVTISCYDSMMKANAPFLPATYTVPEGESWPKYMSVIVQEIASKIGVSVDPNTLTDLQEKETGTNKAQYRVPLLKGNTMKQILEEIGACHGGNFIITEENRLRLVKLKTMFSDSVDTANAIAVLGTLDTGQPATVSGVSREREDGTIYRAGNDTGFVVKLGRRTCATDDMVTVLYNELNGKVYHPFTSTKTVVDPAVEQGDLITLGDKGTFPILTQKVTLDISPYMDISAPGNEEMSEEYPYLTERQLREMADRKLAEDTQTLFQVNKESIESEVVRAQEAESRISQTATEIRSTISASLKQYDETGYNITLYGNGAPWNNGYDAATVDLADGTEYLDKTTGKVHVFSNKNGVKQWYKYAIDGTDVVLPSLRTSVQSQIKQTADRILLQVGRDTVSSKLSVEQGEITIGTGRLAITATNFTLTKDGTVTARNITAKGSLESQSGNYDIKIENGFQDFYYGGSLVGRIGSSLINAEKGIMIDIGVNSRYGGFAVQAVEGAPAAIAFYYDRYEDQFISKKTITSPQLQTNVITLSSVQNGIAYTAGFFCSEGELYTLGGYRVLTEADINVYQGGTIKWKKNDDGKYIT